MKRVILIVLGIVLLLFSIPMLVGGAVLAAWASGEDPTIAGRIGRVDSLGYAVVSDRVEVDWEWPLADRWDISLGVENTNSDVPVFIGYGPTESVDAYLAGSPYTLVYSIGTGEQQRSRDIDVPGTEAPEPPGDQTFWAQQASGVGRQTLQIAPGQGDYRFVAMNADASQGVSLTVYGSMRVPFLQPLGIGMAVFGGLLALLGIILLVLGIRAQPTPKPTPAGYPYGGQPGGAYPGMPYQPAPYPGGQPAQPYSAQPPGPPQGTQPVPPAQQPGAAGTPQAPSAPAPPDEPPPDEVAR